MPNAVTPIMPQKTAVPSVRRISGPVRRPGPGTTPRINATEVITIGLSRRAHASRMASRRGTPASRRVRPNSTIRIAFLHASPTSTTKPICVKMFVLPADPDAEARAASNIGTTRMTASGGGPAFVLSSEDQEDEDHG